MRRILSGVKFLPPPQGVLYVEPIKLSNPCKMVNTGPRRKIQKPSWPKSPLDSEKNETHFVWCQIFTPPPPPPDERHTKHPKRGAVLLHHFPKYFCALNWIWFPTRCCVHDSKFEHDRSSGFPCMLRTRRGPKIAKMDPKRSNIIRFQKIFRLKFRFSDKNPPHTWWEWWNKICLMSNYLFI